MAVKIRLQRMGGKRKPFYRFVVMDSRDRRDGAYLDSLGNYNPIAKPHEIEIDEEKVFKWLGQGAQLTDGARSILSKAGVLLRWEARKGGLPAATPAEPPPPAEAATPAEPREKAGGEAGGETGGEASGEAAESQEQ